jgi:DNA repair protein RadC
LDRMEWMYDWGNKIGQQKTNEEFLTGQKTANPGEKKEKHVFQEEITNRKCEDFQLLHEDPMFEIMKHEKLRKDAIVNNPIEMRNIIKEVEKEYLPQDL